MKFWSNCRYLVYLLLIDSVKITNLDFGCDLICISVCVQAVWRSAYVMAIAYDNTERSLTLFCNLKLNCAVVSAHLCGLSALSHIQQWASAAGVLWRPFKLFFLIQPLQMRHWMVESTLLDFAVILQLLTVKKSSKIPYIWFTVNYCNTHCIMGISVLILQ